MKINATLGDSDLHCPADSTEHCLQTVKKHCLTVLSEAVNGDSKN